ncbi:hypothetical protein N7478_006794 [Penicillium angulare]|uniref:uncharacterized protein n=1 Tax=Penicillium angulare TaxID=116970 RepID=UPI00253FE114|nr:uncharacterized protein N7478_006794 [Penicillium angulare]KAJ5281422.1 hypothetical protein N7478_006794 [Penicillium angulare]
MPPAKKKAKLDPKRDGLASPKGGKKGGWGKKKETEVNYKGPMEIDPRGLEEVYKNFAIEGHDKNLRKAQTKLRHYVRDVYKKYVTRPMKFSSPRNRANLRRLVVEKLREAPDWVQKRYDQEKTIEGKNVLRQTLYRIAQFKHQHWDHEDELEKTPRTKRFASEAPETPTSLDREFLDDGSAPADDDDVEEERNYKPSHRASYRSPSDRSLSPSPSPSAGTGRNTSVTDDDEPEVPRSPGSESTTSSEGSCNTGSKGDLTDDSEREYPEKDGSEIEDSERENPERDGSETDDAGREDPENGSETEDYPDNGYESDDEPSDESEDDSPKNRPRDKRPIFDHNRPSMTPNADLDIIRASHPRRPISIRLNDLLPDPNNPEHQSSDGDWVDISKIDLNAFKRRLEEEDDMYFPEEDEIWCSSTALKDINITKIEDPQEHESRVTNISKFTAIKRSIEAHYHSMREQLPEADVSELRRPDLTIIIRQKNAQGLRKPLTLSENGSSDEEPDHETDPDTSSNDGSKPEHSGLKSEAEDSQSEDSQPGSDSDDPSSDPEVEKLPDISSVRSSDLDSDLDSEPEDPSPNSEVQKDLDTSSNTSSAGSSDINSEPGDPNSDLDSDLGSEPEDLNSELEKKFRPRLRVRATGRKRLRQELKKKLKKKFRHKLKKKFESEVEEDSDKSSELSGDEHTHSPKNSPIQERNGEWVDGSKSESETESESEPYWQKGLIPGPQPALNNELSDIETDDGDREGSDEARTPQTDRLGSMSDTDNDNDPGSDSKSEYSDEEDHEKTGPDNEKENSQGTKRKLYGSEIHDALQNRDGLLSGDEYELDTSVDWGKMEASPKDTHLDKRRRLQKKQLHDIIDNEATFMPTLFQHENPEPLEGHNFPDWTRPEGFSPNNTANPSPTSGKPANLRAVDVTHVGKVQTHLPQGRLDKILHRHTLRSRRDETTEKEEEGTEEIRQLQKQQNWEDKLAFEIFQELENLLKHIDSVESEIKDHTQSDTDEARDSLETLETELGTIQDSWRATENKLYEQLEAIRRTDDQIREKGMNPDKDLEVEKEETEDESEDGEDDQDQDTSDGDTKSSKSSDSGSSDSSSSDGSSSDGSSSDGSSSDGSSSDGSSSNDSSSDDSSSDDSSLDDRSSDDRSSDGESSDDDFQTSLHKRRRSESDSDSSDDKSKASMSKCRRLGSDHGSSDSGSLGGGSSDGETSDGCSSEDE